jgi:WD40 repeat protein
VRSLALSADGSRLVTATEEEPVLRLWDVKTGQLLRAVHIEGELTASMTVFALTPDARRAVVMRHEPYQRELGGAWHEPAVIDLATAAETRWAAAGREPRERHPLFALAPDGIVLAGLIGGEVRVWEPATGRERVLGKIDKPNENTGGICFSPDGHHIAACRTKGAVFLVPVNGNGPLQRIPLERCDEDVLQVFWQQPDRVVALWRYGWIAIDPATGEEHARTRVFDGRDHYLPRGAAGRGKLFGQELVHPIGTFDLATLERIPQRKYPCGLRDPFAVSADGRVLAVATGHAVHLFDPATGEPLHPDLLRAPVEPLVRLDLAADVLLGHTEDNAYVLSRADGRPLAVLEDELRGRFALSPNGRFASGGLTRGERPGVIELRTGRAIPLPAGEPGRDPPEVVGFAGPNRVWLWTEEANVFVPLELGTDRAGTGVPGHEGARFVAVSPDGRKFATFGRKGLAVRDLGTNHGWVVLDTYEERRKVPRCKLGERDPIPVRFSPCGRWLLVSDPHSGLVLWDLRHKPVRVEQFETAARGAKVADGGFSPDGRYLAGAVRTTDGGTALCVWETASAEEVYRFSPSRGVASGTFTPDGRCLVIAHTDTTIGVWDRAGVEARLCGPVPAGEEWNWLSARDAKRARAAMWALVANPERALAVLGAALAPPDAAITNRLLAELGSDDFPVRESAQRALAALGVRAEAALLRAVTKSESPEVRLRAAALLNALGATEARLMGDRLRAVRAVEVLEAIGSLQAKALLGTWAKTYPRSSLAAEVSAALGRMR